MEIISRDEAARKKMRRFFTGKKCRHGHASERYTLSGACVECAISRVLEERAVYREALNG